MNLYRLSQARLAYKAVGYDRETGQAFSLYSKGFKIDLARGSTITTDTREGIFLGSSKQYVLDYYSLLTDEDELLLTYTYEPRDLIRGSEGEGEVRVRKATLVNVELIDKRDEEVVGLKPFTKTKRI